MIASITGTLTALPKHLYRCVSLITVIPFLDSPVCVQLSGNPCNRSHSSGVMYLSFLSFVSVAWLFLVVRV